MPKITTYEEYQHDAKNEFGHYWAVVNKDGRFFNHVEYYNFSKPAFREEVTFLQKQYPKDEGYQIDWQD